MDDFLLMDEMAGMSQNPGEMIGDFKYTKKDKLHGIISLQG